jgi:Sulfotransferase family
MYGQATPGLPQSSQPSKPKVIYVMGAGRSGSTILGVTLGNCEGIFFAGELDKWLARSGVPQLDDAERMQFWRRSRDRVESAEDLFGYSAHRCLERSSALFRVRDWPRRAHLRKPYRRISEELYRAIVDETGADCVVDTSHYPLRARELQGITGIDLYLLFLVRDPQSVVASFSRSDVPERRFNTPTANAYLWLTYLVCLFVFLRHPRDRRLFVRHEDFLSNPDAVLREIFALIGSSAAVPDLARLRTGVAFQGNRLLQSSELALEPTPKRRARSSRSTAILQLPWKIVFALLGARGRRQRPLSI